MDINKLVIEMYGTMAAIKTRQDHLEIAVKHLSSAIEEVSDTNSDNFLQLKGTLEDVVKKVEESKIRVDTTLENIRTLMSRNVVVSNEITNKVESSGDQGDINQNIISNENLEQEQSRKESG